MRPALVKESAVPTDAGESRVRRRAERTEAGELAKAANSAVAAFRQRVRSYLTRTPSAKAAQM